ncbi:MAG: VWA domain-containing protein [Sinobacteraceae bacterium]|nr:VWA domain-containing protein [Nevskiaceae bacterium]
MLEFDWPWLAAALPLPWLLRRWLRPVAANAGPVLRVPDLGDFRVLAGGGPALGVDRWRLLAAALAWLLLVGAAMRPQWVGEPIEVPVSGRDLMLAVDLSESMRETDFVLNSRPVDRLTATKAVAREFIARRVGDRVGLILFGQQAYLHVPLTFDRETVEQLLDEAVIGIAGRQTAIGDALGLAVKRLREEDTADKVLILMTDGRNTAGEVEPLRAADLAAEAGLKVYTIGIGADEAIQRGFFGSVRINPSADLDEATLKAIAKKTGGRYFRARDTAEFEAIYAELDKLEPVEHAGEHFRPRTALFYWPLGAAFLLFCALLVRRTRGMAALATS